MQQSRQHAGEQDRQERVLKLAEVWGDVRLAREVESVPVENGESQSDGKPDKCKLSGPGCALGVRGKPGKIAEL
jgi:hypothetical protein